MRIELSPDQKMAHDAAVAFLRKPTKDHFTIGGLAGTGKTTITAEIVRTMRQVKSGVRFAFACFTGKAALVLLTKLSGAQVKAEDESCSTIHRLIYEPELDKATGEILGWSRVPQISADVIVVDEASMVNAEIWNDLKSYGVPILAIGDHGQLPPVKEQYNLMENPDVRLEKIHRQAEGDPIIRLSMMARNGENIKAGPYGDDNRVWKIHATPEEQLQRMNRVGIDPRSTLFLCAYNRTRALVNRAVRSMLNIDPDNPPGVGESVVCLKNNHDAYIFNGMSGIVKSIKHGDPWHKARIRMVDETEYKGSLVAAQFGALKTLSEHPQIHWSKLRDLFDYGYCLTVHKAQGSESERVVVFDEPVGFLAGKDSSFAEQKAFQARWRYTAITRAKRFLTIVSPRWKNFSPAGENPVERSTRPNPVGIQE